MSSSQRTSPQPSAETPTAPDHTGSRASRIIGGLTIAGLATLLLFAFVLSPPDERVVDGRIIGQYDAVRMLYVHFPSILIAYLGFTVCAAGSAMYLWRKSDWWDTVAGASGEIGTLFLGLTLVTGSIWGKPIWNTWWEWGDVRLMTTLMLFLMFLGYIAVRSLDVDRTVRAKRSAIVALIAVLNIPLVSQSVTWWEDRTLHQQSAATRDGIYYQDLTLFTLFLGFVVFALLFTWLLIHRFRVGWLELQIDRYGYEAALAERRAEAAAGVEAAIGAGDRTDNIGPDGGTDQ